MSDSVRLERVEDGIVRVVMDEAATRNRLSEDLCAALGAALDELARDPGLRALILAGRPDIFCAGATLTTLRRIVSGEVAVRDLALPSQLLGFPMPIVGAVQGDAVGGGLVLAACCDITVAAENGRYGVNFADLGFTPGMGTMALLPALVGHGLAAEMILTSKFYKGRELAGRGLFTHVVPATEVANLALDLARRIADKPRHVLEMIKETMALARRQALLAAMSREHLMHTICFSRPDVAGRIEDSYLP